MKTATFPSLRVDPELREAAEQCLEVGESLSAFLEQSIRDNIAKRQHQRDFLARGLAGREDAARTGKYRSAKEVVAGLEKMLEKARKK